MSDLINYSDENVIHLLKNFAEYYRYLWTIILSDIYENGNIDKIKQKKGILISNFEILKNCYVEAFEILCSILPLFLGIHIVPVPLLN